MLFVPVDLLFQEVLCLSETAFQLVYVIRIVHSQAGANRIQKLLWGLIYRYIRALQQLVHEVMVLCPGYGGGMADRERRLQCKLSWLRLSHLFRIVKRRWGLRVNQWNQDVVIVLQLVFFMWKLVRYTDQALGCCLACWVGELSIYELRISLCCCAWRCLNITWWLYGNPLFLLSAFLIHAVQVYSPNLAAAIGGED